MKCLSEKQMLLFFYNELKEGEAPVKEHLSTCKQCSLNYAKLTGFLNALDKEKVDISRDNLKEIIRQIEPSTRLKPVLARIAQQLSFAAQDILLALTRRPQIAVAALVVIAVVSVFPIVNKHKVAMAREDVVDIEMELVFEDSSNTDVMLDIFNLNSSQKSSSTHISS